MQNIEASIVGVWRSDETGDPFLEFKENGRVSGSDGCNGIGGTYDVEDGTATVALGLSTLKACPGVDTWLRRVKSVALEGDTMRVMDRDGAEIGQLRRRLTSR